MDVTKGGTAGENGHTGGTGQRGREGEIWGNCNTIINKLYLKNQKSFMMHYRTGIMVK